MAPASTRSATIPTRISTVGHKNPRLRWAQDAGRTVKLPRGLLLASPLSRGKRIGPFGPTFLSPFFHRLYRLVDGRLAHKCPAPMSDPPRFRREIGKGYSTKR